MTSITAALVASLGLLAAKQVFARRPTRVRVYARRASGNSGESIRPCHSSGPANGGATLERRRAAARDE